VADPLAILLGSMAVGLVVQEEIWEFEVAGEERTGSTAEPQRRSGLEDLST
jgi:hypothetical protein